MTDAPDLDDGYFRIANTMLPVLMDAPIRREAKFVLLEVIAQCWGKSKLKAATINLRTITMRWGFARVDHVKRGFTQLKELGVLKEAGGEFTVSIDKYALQDIIPADITGGLEAFSEVTKKIHPGPHNRKAKSANASKRASLPQGRNDSACAPQETCEVGGESAPMGVKNGTPYNPLKEEEGRSKKEEDQSLKARERDSDSDSDVERFKGNETPDPTAMAAIRTLIRSRAGEGGDKHGLWRSIVRHEEVYESAWLLKALKRSLLPPRDGSLPHWNYLWTMLKRWAVSPTGPDAGPEDAYLDDLAGMRPVSVSAAPLQSIPMTSMLSPANQRRAALQAGFRAKQAEQDRLRAEREANERKGASVASA